mgnify:CR=1 FL=1
MKHKTFRQKTTFLSTKIFTENVKFSPKSELKNNPVPKFSKQNITFFLSRHFPKDNLGGDGSLTLILR